MDIVAKHMTSTKVDLKVVELNGRTYRKQLWDHQSIIDFLRVGKGYARRLAKLDIYTMGEIAACSLGSLSDRYNKALLCREFGINIEILIDHIWRERFEDLIIKNIDDY